MARQLNFQINGHQLSAEIEKLDRSKLYGHVEKKYSDRDGKDCYFGLITDDGTQMLGRNMVEAGYLTDDGDWLERGDLNTVGVDGVPLEKREASFKQPIELENTVTIDEYLSFVAKSVYQLNAPKLLERVKLEDNIYTFPFNYTASYSPDTAFLIENTNYLFMVVGQATGFEFLEIQEIDTALLIDDDEDEDIDFSMF